MTSPDYRTNGNADFRDMLSMEHALDQWRAARGYAPVGCGAAERLAFTAGWQARDTELERLRLARRAWLQARWRSRPSELDFGRA